MKNRSRVFSFFCFLVFWFFYPACVPHDLETPAKPDAAPSPPKTLQKEVEDALQEGDDFRFYNNSIPLPTVWGHINYNGFDYVAFWKNTCPGPGQSESGGAMFCEYNSDEQFRNFKIYSAGEKIIMEIKKIGYQIGYMSFSIEAVWEISGAENDFSVKKYERITDHDGDKYYAKIETSYKLENGVAKIRANGRVRFPYAGHFSFYMENIFFSECGPALPQGTIHFAGKNFADITFSSLCENCAIPEVQDDNYYNNTVYEYCGPWALRDLFDYLKPFIGLN